MAEGSIHINTGGGNWDTRAQFDCPVCEFKQARIIVHNAGNPYYGPRVVCVECGDAWSDGYLHERPFRRGWRKESQARALAAWDAAPPLGTKLIRDDDLYITGYQLPEPTTDTEGARP